MARTTNQQCGHWRLTGDMMSSQLRHYGIFLNLPSALSVSKMAERPFSVALLFGVVWVALAYLAGFLVFPVWNNLNIGLCCLAICVCVMCYITEYLAKFPISYR